MVALDPETGKLNWHYQFTPNDSHDWDSTEDMILVDRVWHGQSRKLLLHADRNGISTYSTGRTESSCRARLSFIKTGTGASMNGRPKVVPGSNSSPEGSFYVYPTLGRNELSGAFL